jgi:hypothetical protein
MRYALDDLRSLAFVPPARGRERGYGQALANSLLVKQKVRR